MSGSTSSTLFTEAGCLSQARSLMWLASPACSSWGSLPPQSLPSRLEGQAAALPTWHLLGF